jgi:hypothetical protein
VNGTSSPARSMVAHNTANVSVMQNPAERLGLSVRGVYHTRDVCELDIAALSPFLDRKVLNVVVPRTFSRSIRIHHIDGSLVLLVKQCWPRWGKPSSMRMDRRYLAILAASRAAMNSLSVLEVATVGCSFHLKAIAPPARQKDKPVTDRRVRRSLACDAST